MLLLFPFTVGDPSRGEGWLLLGDVVKSIAAFFLELKTHFQERGKEFVLDVIRLSLVYFF